jgi:NAD(P) transhydrogenase subunit beta
VLFILALRGLSSPASARQGNNFGMVGMAIAMRHHAGRRRSRDLLSWALIMGGLAIGGGIGAVMARQVKMTDMPQLVAAFHSLVGLAAVFVAAAALYAPEAFGIGEAGHIHAQA